MADLAAAVTVAAVADGDYDVFCRTAEDAEGPIVAAIADAMAHHRGGPLSVVVIRDGSIVHRIQDGELAGLKASVAEARRAAVAAWWKATGRG